jgi:hypothetical protein
VVPPPDAFLMDTTGLEQEADDDDHAPPFVLAKYDGKCSACEQWHILADITMIRADGYDGWEAEECAW